MYVMFQYNHSYNDNKPLNMWDDGKLIKLFIKLKICVKQVR